ncbi:MAG: dihydroneopterin aldolase family protein [Candidatus Methanomethylophilaceae archaeon]|nr:dihydroneopterin aldolase family protein [Candidatus Methanomethylophilaceae archaeon]
MSQREERADSMFGCTTRERAVFEAGIKMGTIYHQFVGTPFNTDTVTDLEDLIGRTIGVQPYVESAVVRIDRSVFNRGDDTYSYVSLTGDMIDAVVRIRIGDTVVTSEMRYDPELDYPLMYVSSIE